MNKSWLVLRSNTLPVSLRLDRRVPSVLAGISLVTLLALIFHVGYGEYFIPPLAVVKTLLGLETGNPEYAFIIQTLRLPRALVALLVGMGLAVSGGILQGLTRNPLAAPDIIGINAGASLAAVAVIILFPGLPIWILPLVAFSGALVVALLIYTLAWDQGSSPIRLILVGIGIAAIATALTTILITFGEINSVSQALVWMTGSVYGRSWEHLWPLLPWLGTCLPLAMLWGRDLNTLNLGDSVARGLGSQVERQRGLLLILSVALAGAAVATAGAIGFVGLVAPHIARQLVGPSHEGLIPTTALMGGMIVVLSDLFGRILFAPIELPCGVIIAAIGAPYFLFLLYRSRNA